MTCIFYLSYATISCVKKPETMEGPTMGKLDILADESIRYVAEQEENIFESTYKYADVNIMYMPEVDMFNKFTSDTFKAIMSTRPLSEDEITYFVQKGVTPRQYVYATSALAFITQKNQPDTTFTYEEMVGLMSDKAKGKVFVIENAKSGISNEILRVLDADTLPGHFYALNSKQEVIDYIEKHINAIGIIDWSDISDSDSVYSKEVLNSIELVGVARPVDSTQHGFLKPYQYNLQDRKYPFTRDLYFISTTGKSDVGMGFASFIAGEIGQKIILKSGLLPKYQSERIVEIKTSPDIKVIK